jgi:hypothetical protein
LNDNVTDTNYTDSGTAFNTHYFYQVKAVDGAGNSSDFATVDVQTKAFSANTTGSADTTVTSDDGKASAIVPAGAVDADADCSLVSDDSTQPPKSGAVLAGPYKLLCLKASGDPVDGYKSAVTVVIKLSSDQIKNYRLQTIAGDQNGLWSAVKNFKIDTKARAISFSLANPVSFAVLGTKKPNYWPLILSIFIPVVLLFGGALYYRLNMIKKTNYKEYIRRKYYNL